MVSLTLSFTKNRSCSLAQQMLQAGCMTTESSHNIPQKHFGYLLLLNTFIQKTKPSSLLPFLKITVAHFIGYRMLSNTAKDLREVPHLYRAMSYWASKQEWDQDCHRALITFRTMNQSPGMSTY